MPLSSDKTAAMWVWRLISLAAAVVYTYNLFFLLSMGFHSSLKMSLLTLVPPTPSYIKKKTLLDVGKMDELDFLQAKTTSIKLQCEVDFYPSDLWEPINFLIPTVQSWRYADFWIHETFISPTALHSNRTGVAGRSAVNRRCLLIEKHCLRASSRSRYRHGQTPRAVFAVGLLAAGGGSGASSQ